MIPVEVLPRRQVFATSTTRLTDEDLDWLRATWLIGGRMMDSSSVFNDVAQAFDSAGSLPSPSVAMVAVWGALEHLFSPAKQELRFRVAANIASYLEPPGKDRLILHRRIMKLYDARSSAAHGTRLKSTDTLSETVDLARRALLKMLASGNVPSKEELDSALFAPTE